jgi:hypothetical protein
MSFLRTIDARTAWFFTVHAGEGRDPDGRPSLRSSQRVAKSWPPESAIWTPAFAGVQGEKD